MLSQAERRWEEQEIIGLASFMMRKYYCENDVDAVIRQMDDDIVWLGAGEHEYAFGGETVTGIFRRFEGQVPKCNISDEEYHVLSVGPDLYLCTGRMWIATDASTQISLRVHQRVTVIFRRVEEALRCCHIHISNPYQEMVGDDVGFPLKMAQQSYEYLREQVDAQKKLIEEQTAVLQRMIFQDTLTGLFNRNKFNQVMNEGVHSGAAGIGIACFDLNGLKEVNDRQGHSAGDDLICRAADQIRQVFGPTVYRTGGDEFVVIQNTMEEPVFRDAIQTVRGNMEKHNISCSIGASWKSGHSNLKEQLDEADDLMYQDKRNFYSSRERGRRT